MSKSARGGQQVFQKALELSGSGQLSEARQLLLKAAGDPKVSTETLQLLGAISSDLGLNEEAIRHLRRAVALAPKSVSAHFNLGNALLKHAEYEPALASFNAALALKPNHAPFLAAAGDALTKLGRQDEAIAQYCQAIAIAPDQPHAHENLGRVLYKLDRRKEAVKSLQQAIRLAPKNFEAIALLGKALLDLELISQALEALADVLRLRPDHASSLALLMQGRQTICDWTDYGPNRERLSDFVRRKTVAASPFSMLLISDEPELHLAAAARTSHYEPPAKPISFPARGQPDRKLRLGYVSADYRRHAIPILASGLFPRHDRERFEVFAFSLGEDDGSDFRKRLVFSFDDFFDVRQRSSEAIAEEMRRMEIDIAIDLTSHTKDGRPAIFQNRAAPIQVNYLGYPGTSGADYMDYIILDPFIASERVCGNLSEKPVILPHCYQVNDRARPFPQAMLPRAECGLPETGFVFCAFNNPQKITPDIFDVWMRILGQVDGSVLWLVAEHRTILANLRREAEARGISPDRLVFGTFMDLEQHLPRYRVADLFLDTLPYGAHTTTSDALWMGCPVLTCAGESFAARVAGSLLQTVGLPELITGDLRGYERLAVELAANPKRLAEMRARLAAVRLTTPLFDTALFTADIERAYLEMWRLHQSGEAPREIVIPASEKAAARA
jgi:protein O-GlcNAc transferase